MGTAALLSALAPIPADSDIASLQHRLATLTSRRQELVRRLAAIEANSPAPMLLRSPVDIQDRAGNSIVYISKGEAGRGLSVFNERRQMVAGLDKSTVFTLAGQGGGGIRFAYGPGGPALWMWNGPKPVATIGPDGFTSFAPAGNPPTAQLGAFREAGHLSLGDVDGSGMVEAGMLSNRKNVGVVRVAPFIPRMELLLPITPYRIPNFIRGYRPK